MGNVPPPRAGPMLKPVPAEGKTDPAIKIERLYAAYKEGERRKVWNAVKKWAQFGALIGGVFAGVFSFFHSKAAAKNVEEHKSATAQAIEDEKHQRERDVDEIKQISTDHADEHRKLDRRLERVDTKLELLLDAARVPRSKRPTEDE